MSDQNYTEEYVDWATAFTHSPGIFHHFLAYWTVSAVLRGNIWMRQGKFRSYPNLWLITIAQSSWFGKTTAINIARDLIEQAVPDLFYPDEFSHENLIKNMAKKPQGNFVFSEFRSLMKLLDRDFMSGTKSFLTDLYDCPKSRKRTVGVKDEKEYIIDNPVINIVAATTIDWYTDTVKDRDILSGFIPRFIMIPAKKQDLFYPRQKLPDQETEARLVDTLKSIATLRGECWLTDEAGKLYDSLALKFYGKHHMNGNLCSPFYPRLINYALKFSMLNSCINQHYPNILEMDVEMAWDTIRRLTKAINDIVENEVTFSPEQANRKRVYDYLKHDYPRAVSWSELLRYTKLKTADLREATDALLQGDQIDEVKDDGPNGPGRPKRSFKFIKQEEEPDLGEQENEN